MIVSNRKIFWIHQNQTPKAIPHDTVEEPLRLNLRKSWWIVIKCWTYLGLFIFQLRQHQSGSWPIRNLACADFKFWREKSNFLHSNTHTHTQPCDLSESGFACRKKMQTCPAGLSLSLCVCVCKKFAHNWMSEPVHFRKREGGGGAERMGEGWQCLNWAIK